MLQLDKDIKFNPQKYYISIRKTRNFAYVELRKKKMNIVIMLPYEVGSKLIKRHTITKLSESVQNWYGAPCFQVTVENEADIEEVVRALEEAYRQSQNLTQIRR
jgi:predicted transport protein